ncbi:MAG: hypothetical protein CL910_01550 [Deltaproteobacteria bacterium]|jgi:undecaprenyl-diphosphatase|nr:hypothetical protein [Deltaproteobacteria bacterium]
MGLFEAAWLGIVQGLTEFLPVSSSGHLVMAETLLGQADANVVFEVSVHAGTLLAILVFYRARIGELIRGLLTSDPAALRDVAKLVVATLPAVVAGLTAKEFFESLFATPQVVGYALLVTGLLLLTIRWTLPRAHAQEPTFPQAFWIGCAQVLAITPGISRSGTTVAVALALGVAPLAATEFSFLMGAAAITGASVLALPDVVDAGAATLLACGIGSVTAALSGLVALRWFVRLIESQRFHVFAYYCVPVGLSFLAYLALR